MWNAKHSCNTIQDDSAHTGNDRRLKARGLPLVYNRKIILFKELHKVAKVAEYNSLSETVLHSAQVRFISAVPN